MVPLPISSSSLSLTRFPGMRPTSVTSSSVSPFFPILDHTPTLTSLETASGHTQWEHPAEQPLTSPDPQRADTQQAHPAHAKRRQYAPGQTQAYYGDGVAPDPTYGATLQQQPPAGGQLFTPGLVPEQQFAAQQQQQQPGQQPPYYQPEHPEYLSAAPQYGQQPQPTYAQAPMDALAGQFGQMGVGGGQKPFQLYTTNLLTSPPEPRDLYRPPPEIRLPPNSCISPSPTANADQSYKRCTLNTIPTTSSLLGKARVPLALIITPYRTLKEGDEPVPLVTDTVIARCRRCRTYINPYVQFIDGGNRYVCRVG